MDFDKIDRKIRNRRKEWMFPLGILFLIMAVDYFFQKSHSYIYRTRNRIFYRQFHQLDHNK